MDLEQLLTRFTSDVRADIGEGKLTKADTDHIRDILDELIQIVHTED